MILTQDTVYSSGFGLIDKIGMESLTRHFVTRVLGRGTVEARLDEDGSAKITIVFGDGALTGQSFTLSAAIDVVAQFSSRGNDLLFRLSRIAITQVQTAVLSANGAMQTQVNLNAGGSPWNGDLTSTPYGGATTGCTKLFAGEPKLWS